MNDFLFAPLMKAKLSNLINRETPNNYFQKSHVQGLVILRDGKQLLQLTGQGACSHHSPARQRKGAQHSKGERTLKVQRVVGGICRVEYRGGGSFQATGRSLEPLPDTLQLLSG